MRNQMIGAYKKPFNLNTEKVEHKFNKKEWITKITEYNPLLIRSHRPELVDLQNYDTDHKWVWKPEVLEIMDEYSLRELNRLLSNITENQIKKY